MSRARARTRAALVALVGGALVGCAALPVPPPQPSLTCLLYGLGGGRGDRPATVFFDVAGLFALRVRVEP